MALTAGIVLSGGPGSGDAKAETFVGRVPGSNAYIAVLKDGRKVGGYVCDNAIGSRWIVSGRRARGTILVRGVRRRFRGTRVRERDGGLHFAIGKQPNRLLVGGWILHSDGTQRGAVSRLDMESLQSLETTAAPRLDADASKVQMGGDTDVPPVVAEPQQLVVVTIIGVLIGLLLPAIQKERSDHRADPAHASTSPLRPR